MYGVLRTPQREPWSDIFIGMVGLDFEKRGRERACE